MAWHRFAVVCECLEDLDGEDRLSFSGHPGDQDVAGPLVFSEAEACEGRVGRVENGADGILATALVGWWRVEKDALTVVFVCGLKEQDFQELPRLVSLVSGTGEIELPE